MTVRQGFAKIILIFLFLALAGLGGYFFLSQKFLPDRKWDKRIAAAFAAADSTDCPPAATTINTPDFGNYYTGTLIDTHYHIPHLPDSWPGDPEYNLTNDPQPLLGKNVTIHDIVCTMNQENTTTVFGFFSVFPHMDWQSLEVVRKTMELYPNDFVPFIMTPDNDNDKNGSPTVNADALSEFLNQYPGLFKGYGEIGLYARDGGANELPPDDQRLLDIYPIIREHNLLVYFHLGEGHEDNFERALEQNPDINFIWHGDQLVTYKDDGSQDLSKIEKILENHPNAYYGVDELYGDIWLLRPEVSKKEFLAHFEDYENLLDQDLATWKGFIERHPDQVLWGTDRGWSSDWSIDSDVGLTLTRYTRAFIARLDPAVQEKFAYKNAQKLMESVGAVEDKPATIGYIGCSNTRQIVDGYRMVGGRELWKPDIENMRDYDGGAVADWVKNAESGNKFWDVFDNYLVQNPGTTAVWWQLCVRQEDQTTYDNVIAVLTAIRKRLPNAKIYVSALAGYANGICQITGVDGIEKGNELAQELADRNADVVLGPKFDLLQPAEVLEDGCHLTTMGMRSSGNKLKESFKHTGL